MYTSGYFTIKRLIVCTTISLLLVSLASFAYLFPLPFAVHFPASTLQVVENKTVSFVTKKEGITYVGSRDWKLDTEVFGGITYAFAQRFKAPIPWEEDRRKEWHDGLDNGVSVHTAFGPTCAGPVGKPKEECLTLDVFRPSRRSETLLLPVLVWFDDTAFMYPERQSHYPARLVQKSVDINLPIILVTFNYRLGASGYFVFGGMEHKDISMGLKDQKEALRWLKAHIEDFGGDPDKITVIGQDSGATSIGLHILFSDDEPLFRAAILQSGYPTSYPVNSWLDTVLRSSNLLGVRVGCEHVEPWLDCIRDSEFDVMLGASNSMYDGGLRVPWYPVVDEEWITEKPSERLKKEGKWKSIPVLCGSSGKEARRFSLPTVNTPEDLRHRLSEFVTLGREVDPLAPIFDKLEEYYHRPSLSEEFRDVLADILVHAPRRLFMQSMESTWGYILDAQDEHDEKLRDRSEGLTWGDPEWKKREPWLSDRLTKYLLSFVYYMDPNGWEHETTTSFWPKYGEEKNIVLFKKNNMSVVFDDFRAKEIELINDNNALFNR